MKKIHNYTNFINELNSIIIKEENITENLIASKYIDGVINDKHIDKFLFDDLNDFLAENNIILEGINIKELLTKGKDAIMNWFFNVLHTVIEKGKQSLKKVAGLLKSVFNVIKKFTNKYPKLTKVLVILIVIVAIMVLSAQSAMAGTGGELSPEDLQQMGTIIDATIGFMGDEMFKGESISSVSDITNMLLKVKQNMLDPGSVDTGDVPQQLKDVTKAAFNYVNSFTDSEIADYAKKGVDFVNQYGVK